MNSSGKAQKCRNIHMTSNSHDMGIGLYPPKRLVNRYIIGISVVVRLISILYSHFDLLQFQSQRWSDMLCVLNYSASLCSELERSAAVYSNQVNYKVIGHVNEYPTMRYFGIVNESIYDFVWVFLEIPVKNLWEFVCIVGMLLTCLM